MYPVQDAFEKMRPGYFQFFSVKNMFLNETFDCQNKLMFFRRQEDKEILPFDEKYEKNSIDLQEIWFDGIERWDGQPHENPNIKPIDGHSFGEERACMQLLTEMANKQVNMQRIICIEYKDKSGQTELHYSYPSLTKPDHYTCPLPEWMMMVAVSNYHRFKCFETRYNKLRDEMVEKKKAYNPNTSEHKGFVEMSFDTFDLMPRNMEITHTQTFKGKPIEIKCHPYKLNYLLRKEKDIIENYKHFAWEANSDDSDDELSSDFTEQQLIPISKIEDYLDNDGHYIYPS